jgi:hypothetical protein
MEFYRNIFILWYVVSIFNYSLSNLDLNTGSAELVQQDAAVATAFAVGIRPIGRDFSSLLLLLDGGLHFRLIFPLEHARDRRFRDP